MDHARVPAHIIRAVSVEACCDPRTVERALRGESGRPMVDERIRAALTARGITPPTNPT